MQLVTRPQKTQTSVMQHLVRRPAVTPRVVAREAARRALHVREAGAAEWGAVVVKSSRSLIKGRGGFNRIMSGALGVSRTFNLLHHPTPLPPPSPAR